MSKEKEMIELLRKAGYSEKAVDYYIRKLNVGEIEGAEAVDSYTGLCGDSMKIYLKVEEGAIKDVKFQAIVCAGAFASGSALTEIWFDDCEQAVFDTTPHRPISRSCTEVGYLVYIRFLLERMGIHDHEKLFVHVCNTSGNCPVSLLHVVDILIGDVVGVHVRKMH